jgi:hypothetical protein
MQNPSLHGRGDEIQGNLSRIVNALRYIWDGLKAAAKHEEAFKQELILVVPSPSPPGSSR